MLVKIAPLGERVVEVNVEAGTTVGQILDIGGIELNDRIIKVNNVDATESTQVTAEGAIVVLARQMKGGVA